MLVLIGEVEYYFLGAAGAAFVVLEPIYFLGLFLAGLASSGLFILGLLVSSFFMVW